jgi:hypothetical protein
MELSEILSTESYIFDDNRLEVRGRVLPLAFLFLPLLIGIIMLVVTSLSLIWRTDTFDLILFNGMFGFLFILFLLLSIFVFSKYYLNISETGIIYQIGNKITNVSWENVRLIRTSKELTLGGTRLTSAYFVTITNSEGKINLNELSSVESDPYFLGVVLLFKYAGKHSIPFDDFGNLLNDKRFEKMGIFFPGIKNRGKYFMKPEPVRFKPKQVKVTIPCPECTEMVIPMRIGRCPKCGYRFNESLG